MIKITKPAHRPSRRFPNAPRKILQPEVKVCPYCHAKLKSTGNISINREVQTMDGALNVRAYSWRCRSEDCPCPDVRYRAQRELWRISLPKFGYGLDVVAYIGWQHDQKFRQFCEIQLDLQSRGILISERHVGRLYRQYLSLLGGLSDQKLDELKKYNSLHGGVVWALDALQPDQDGTQLYVLYEAISETTVAAAWLDKRDTDHLIGWLEPYTLLNLTVLGTLSDGEEAEIKALKTLWSNSPHQMCLTHFLGDCAKPIKKANQKLKAALRQGMGSLPPVPGDQNSARARPIAATPVLQEPTSDDKARQTDNLYSTNNKNVGDKDETIPDYNSTLHVSNDAIFDDLQIEPKQEAQIPNVQLPDCGADIKKPDTYNQSTEQSEKSYNKSVLIPHMVQKRDSNLPQGDSVASLTIGAIEKVPYPIDQPPEESKRGFASSVNQISQKDSSRALDLSLAASAEVQTDLLDGVELSSSCSSYRACTEASSSTILSAWPNNVTILTTPQADHDLATANSDPSSQFVCSAAAQVSEEREVSSPICQEQLQMRQIEHLLRKSFQQVLRHPSRYPSTFGALAGYQQLQGIIQAMRERVPQEEESYLHRLLASGEQALDAAADLAGEVMGSAQLLAQLTNILFEPLSEPLSDLQLLSSEKSGADVKKEAIDLLDLANSRPGSLSEAFITQSKSLILKWEGSLFNCYDVPLLPANNAALESRFNRLRRGQRRISGRKSTTELRRTAHLQLLLYAESEEELLEQFFLVPEEAYLKTRISLEAAEEVQRQMARLRRKPYETASALIDKYFKLSNSNKG